MISKGLWGRKERVTEQDTEREEDEPKRSEAAETSMDFPSAKAATESADTQNQPPAILLKL